MKQNIESFEASDFQKGIIYHVVNTSGRGIYNVQMILDFAEHVDPMRLEQAWNTAIKELDVLRTFFYGKDLVSLKFKFARSFMIKLKYFENQENYEELIDHELNYKFDHTVAPLFKISLFKINTLAFKMTWTFCHAILDAESAVKIIRYVLNIYNNIPNSDMIYAKETVTSNNSIKEKYWSDSLENTSSFDNYLMHKSPFTQPDILIARLNFYISENQSIAINKTVENCGVTLNTAILGAWALLYLGFNNNVENTIIGSVRAKSGYGLGANVNTLPIVAGLNPEQSIRDFLLLIRQQQIFLRENSESSIIDINSMLKRTAFDIFESVVDFKLKSVNELFKQNYNFGAQALNMRFNTHYPLFLESYIEGNSLHFRINYNKNIYSNDEIISLVKTFKIILSQISNSQLTYLKDICFVSHVFINKIETNIKTLAKLKYKNDLTELINNNISQYAKQNAIITNNLNITYQELGTKINKVINGLNQYVAENSVVAISMSHTCDMVTMVLALLISNYTFVPIDPHLPKKRVARMLEDANCNTLIVDGLEYTQELDFTGNIFNFTDLINWKSISIKKKTPRVNPAYIIFTSGSTGKPKGVVISYKALSNSIISLRKSLFETSINVSGLCHTSIGFDIFYLEILLPLISGGTVILFKQNSDSSKLLDINSFIREYSNHIDFLQGTPSFFENILNIEHKFPKIKTIICGGEKLSLELSKKLRVNCYNLYNVYGPTEATIWSSYYNIRSSKISKVFIGKCLPNTEFVLTNQCGQFVPQYGKGELNIFSSSLSNGYLDSTITKKKYIKYKIGNESFIAFKTGDIAQSHGENRLEIIGRNDSQIKHYGYRIELTEVEDAIKSFNYVLDTIVIYIENPSNLVAFVLLQPKSNILSEDILVHIKSILPHYMVPETINIIDKFPLNINGKADKLALVKFARNNTKIKDSDISENNIYILEMCKIFNNGLSIQVHRNSNFFHNGGNSLNAINVISRIKDVFNIDISLIEFFNNATPLLLASLIEHKKSINTKIVETLAHIEAKVFPLTNSQLGILFFDNFVEQSYLYNLPLLFEVSGPLKIQKLKKSIKLAILRERTFQVNFNSQNQQVIQDYKAKDIKINDIDNFSEEIVYNLIHQTFNLNKAPLFNINILKKESSYCILIVFHHIIMDAQSIVLFSKNLSDIYNNISRQNLDTLNENNTFDYLDYSIYERKMYISKDINSISFWTKKLSKINNINTFPYNINDQEHLARFSGDTYTFYLDKYLSYQLEMFSHENNVTIFSNLASMVILMLFLETKQHNLVIGTTSANRSTLTEKMIGFFSNALPINAIVDEDMSFLDFSTVLNNDILEMLTYQNTPFEKIVDALKLKRNIMTHPIFQVALVYLNMEYNALDFNGLTTARHDVFTDSSKFDLTFYVRKENDRLKFTLEYSTGHYTKNYISTLATKFDLIVKYILSEPKQKIKNLINIQNDQPNSENNNKLMELYSPISLAQAFRNSVEKYSNCVCLTYGNKHLTYDELDKLSNQYAHFFKFNGIGAEERIILYIPRGVLQVVLIISILKLGCVYIPIDVRTPVLRLEEVLCDSKANAIISYQKIDIKSDKYKLFELSKIDIKNYSNKFNEVYTTKNGTAYVIYTSGSTGKPKGVVVTHKNVLRLIETTKSLFDFSSKDIWTFFHSYAFDFSVWEIWGAILTGAQLVVVSEINAKSPDQFFNLIRKHKVTILNQTPTAFSGLIQKHHNYDKKLNSLRYVIFGGEKLNFALLRDWFSWYNDNSPKMINMYGITETTVHATFYHIKQQDVIGNSLKSVIGKILPDLHYYILDDNLKATNNEGELYIGGHGVASGYLNQPQLTSMSFIDNPFKTGEKIYKTGDLVSKDNDGNLIYLSRKDDQIKFHGYRIELDDINNNLCNYDQISQAATLPIIRDDQSILAAFIVPKIIKKEKSWKSVFDELYSSLDKDKVSENEQYIGWNESYTNIPIDVSHMKEWKDATIRTILEYKPQKVLEIGAGSGLLVYDLLAFSKEYLATDISENAGKHILNHIDKKLENKIKFLHQEANDFSNVKNGYHDFIIINSVAQYFTTGEYFLNVINQAIKVVKSKGKIFVGDLRDLRLLNSFEISRIKYKLKHLDNNDILSLSSLLAVLNKELFIHPLVFKDMLYKNKKVSGVDIFIKRGNYTNELNKYRFDVLIHIDDVNSKDYNLQVNTQAFNSKKFNLILQKNRTIYRFSNILNKRLLDEINLEYNYKNINKNTNIKNPEEIAQIAEQSNYKVKLLISLDNPLAFHLICIPIELYSNPMLYSINRLDDIAEPNNFIESYFNKPFLTEINLAKVRQYLKNLIPEYMLPSRFIALPTIPLNKNNKIDKSLLKNLYSFLSNDSMIQISARHQDSEIITLISSITESILGINKIDPLQSFFDIGGDSISAIQLMLKLKSHGYILKLVDLFKAKDFRSLANILEKQKNSNENEVLGEFNSKSLLLPIHYWFFEQKLANYNFWNQAYDIEIKSKINLLKLKKSIHRLIQSQKIFSYRFINTTNQLNCISSEKNAYEIFEFEEYYYEKSDNTIFRNLQNKIDIINGPIVIFIIYLKNKIPYKLTIICHHLYIDTISWIVLIDSLNHIYNNDEVYNNIGNDLNVYHGWKNYLLRFLNNRENLSYWQKSAKFCRENPIPPKFLRNNFYNNEAVQFIELDSLAIDGFKILKENLNLDYFDVLATICLRNISIFTNNNKVWMNIERHGRESLNANVDISHNVGWFTSIYPFTYEVVENESLVDMAVKVKFNLANVPTNGISYGVFKYLNLEDNEDVSLLSYPIYEGINFNYMGILDANETVDTLFKLSKPSSILLRDQKNSRPSLIEINAFVKDSNLNFIIYYPSAISKNIMKNFVNKIKSDASSLSNKIIYNTRLKEESIHCSNFQFLALNKYNNSFDTIKFAFHQLEWQIDGDLNIDAYIQAWKDLVNYADIFQLSFKENDGKCLPSFDTQITKDFIKLHDISTLKEQEQLVYLKELKNISLKRNIPLNLSPLCDIKILKLSNGFKILFTYHQMILDGWSLSLLFQYLPALYEKIQNKPTISLPKLGSYKNYLTNIKSVNFSEGVYSFWANAFKTIEFSKIIYIDKNNALENIFGNFITLIDKSMVDSIKDICIRLKITVNTFFASAWSIALNRVKLSSSYGMMVSGRNIHEIETSNILGTFTNVLPVLIPVKNNDINILDWLKNTHYYLLERQEYENFLYEDLIEHINYEISFDSLYIFQNYPNIRSAFSSFSGLSINEINSIESTNYPITLRVSIYGDEPLLKIAYDTKIFNLQAIIDITDAYVSVLKEIMHEVKKIL